MQRPANLRFSKPGTGQNRGGNRMVALNKYAAKAVQANRRGQGAEARKQRRGRGPRVIHEDEADHSEGTENEFMSLVDPAPKQEVKPYDPTEITIESLQQDWPSFPVSSSISQLYSVEEQLRWLARRFPHSHDTTHELAQRLIKGEIVAFESEAEKQTILSIVAQMQTDLAEQQSEEKGEEVKAKEIKFQGMTDQVKELSSVYIRGDYSQLEKQKYPLLDSVLNQLRNNGTYGQDKSARLLAKIQSLIPQQRQQSQGKGAKA